MLGAGIPLLGGISIPLDGFHQVTAHPPALRVHDGQGQLTRNTPLLGGPADPFAGFLQVPHHTASQVVQGTELHLGGNIPFLGRTANPLGSLDLIPWYAVTLVIFVGQLHLSPGVSLCSFVAQFLNRIVLFRRSCRYPHPRQTQDQQPKGQQRPGPGRHRFSPHGHLSHPDCAFPVKNPRKPRFPAVRARRLPGADLSMPVNAPPVPGSLPI